MVPFNVIPQSNDVVMGRSRPSKGTRPKKEAVRPGLAPILLAPGTSSGTIVCASRTMNTLVTEMRDLLPQAEGNF